MTGGIVVDVAIDQPGDNVFAASIYHLSAVRDANIAGNAERVDFTPPNHDDRILNGSRARTVDQRSARNDKRTLRESSGRDECEKDQRNLHNPIGGRLYPLIHGFSFIHGVTYVFFPSVRISALISSDLWRMMPAAPRRTLMSCETTLMPISSAVTAPISIPIGAWTRSRSCRCIPLSTRCSIVVSTFRLLPIMPMYRAGVLTACSRISSS